jgi:hypothetical protein
MKKIIQITIRNERGELEYDRTVEAEIEWDNSLKKWVARGENDLRASHEDSLMAMILLTSPEGENPATAGVAPD